MKTLAAYTLVELIISIAIISILIILGLSAYIQAQGRQVGKSAAELIVSLLQENQKQANIGDKDCPGAYLSQNITFTLPNTMTSVSECSDGLGTPKSTTIANITFTNSDPISFKPLNSGVDLGGESSLLLKFTSNQLTYQIKVASPGTIEYQGIQP